MEQKGKCCGDELIELIERMESRRQDYPTFYTRFEQNAYNTAITRCIALIEEALKANSKEV